MAALIIALVGTAALSQPLNLIDNPGFERGLSGWRTSFGTAASLDTEVRHGGRASARLQVEDEVGGIDSCELIVDQDITLAASHRVSAWVKSGGVEKGDFGGRVKKVRATVSRFPYLDLPRNQDYDLNTVPSGVPGS